MHIEQTKKIFWKSLEMIAEKKGASMYIVAKEADITPVMLRQRDKLPSMKTILKVLEWADMSLRDWADMIIYITNEAKK